MVIVGALVVMIAIGTAAALWVTIMRLRASMQALRVAAELDADRTRTMAVELDRLRYALDALDDGVVIATTERELFRNRAAQRFSGARHSDAIVEAAIAQVARTALLGASAQQEHAVFGPPSQVYLLRSEPIGGSVDRSGVVVWIRDISDARRLDDVRRDFVANVSHELRTPVGALTLLAETMVDEPSIEIVQQFAQRMVRETERLARTVDDLLDLSVIEANPAAQPIVLEVRDVVDAAVDQIANAALVADIPIQIDGDIDAAVLGDRRQLVSALFNLLENAVKYSTAGDPIAIGIAREGESVLIRIHDHGIGIPTRDLERIFERFYRVDRARSRDSGGTGLGLSIVRHVAAAHSGSVCVSSHEGEGSVFTMKLPIHHADRT